MQRANKSRACAKTPAAQFGNNQIFDMENFVKVSSRIQWSENEFSNRLAQEPTAVGACSPAIAVLAASRRWLFFDVRLGV